MSTSERSDREPGKLPDAEHLESNQGAEVMQVLENDGVRAKVVHADGTVDYVDAQAIGGELESMPRGYFMSPQFIGTVVVRTPPHYSDRVRRSWTDLYVGSMSC